MKRIIIVCGLIAGIILCVFMVSATAMCYANENFEGNMALGYASMILAFSLIFIGVKNYRDKYNDRVISFGKAFTIGLYITLIASSMYVVTWLIDYYLFIPDFLDKYGAHMLRKVKADGATQAEINKQVAEISGFKEMYRNPLFVVLITYAEVLPVGLIISLISALILKRKSAPNKL